MRRPLASLLAAAVLFAVPFIDARPALAAETYTAAADGSFAISGRGYGHGRGMSQWGAYGAAQSGLSPAQILSFYYPGTALTGQPNSTIEVSLSKAQSGQIAVDHAGGMVLVWSGGVLSLPSTLGGSAVTSWRLRNAGGLVLDASTGSSWTQYSYVPGGYGLFQASSANVRLIGPDGSRTEYRGAVGARTSGSTVQAYNSVAMETYLRSVVPSEMPPSWHPNALAAQSIAARTYASLERYSATGAFDTCDTVSCQVYNGVAKYSAGGALIARYENAATDNAIAATANQVLITGGAYSYAFTQFSAANGGYTVAGNKPYLVAKADPYDGVVPSTSHAWDSSITQSALRAAYPGIGTITSLTITARDGNGEWGGRIEQIKVTGTSGSSTVTGSQFRTALGLKSTWWTVKGGSGGSGGGGDGGGAQVEQVGGGLLLDINGDGAPELLGREAATGAMWMYAGNSGGTFGSGKVVSGGWQGFDAIVMPGDATGDGIPDLYAREKSTGTLFLYPLNRQGVPVDKRPSGGGGWQTMSMIIPIGDLTGDGIPDLYAREASTGDLYFYRGAAGGGFASKTLVNKQWNGLDVVLGSGDHNGDGLADLIAREKGTGTLLLYTTGYGGAITGRKAINYGWQMFDALAIAPLGNQSRVYGRDPSRQSGTLSMYPVTAGGSVSPAVLAGYGWNMFNILT